MRQRLILLLSAVLAVSYLFTLYRHSSGLIDFPAFYSAGQLHKEGRQTYDLQSQCAVQSKLSSAGCLPFAHPPLLVPVLSLVAVEDFKLAYRCFVLFLISLIGICAFLAYRLTHDVPKTCALITFLPIYFLLNAAQSTPLILLGALLFVYALREKREFLAGLCLALASVKPHIALALGLPLLVARPRAFAGFVVGGLAVLIYSVALVGVDGIKGMMEIMLLMSRGEGLQIARERMYNFAGLVARNDLDARLIWPMYLVGIGSITFLWKRFGLTLPTIGIGIVIALFTAPHLHLHDLALLIVPMMLFPAWFPLLASALFAAGLGTPLLHLYSNVLLIVIATSCWFQQRLTYAREPAPSQI